MSRRKGIVKKRSGFPSFPKAQFKPGFGHAILTSFPDQTAFGAPAAACDFGPLRFARKLANMALARAGKSR
jgi:hypothetical protein